MGNELPPQPGEPERPGGADWGEMKGKLTAARGADRLILIAGLVFIVDSFLPWYGVKVLGFSANASGWSSGGLAVVAILFAIGATAFAAVRVLGIQANLGDLKDGSVYLVLGAGAFAFTLLRLLTQTDFAKYGLFIALVAGAALAYGGFQKNKQPA